MKNDGARHPNSVMLSASEASAFRAKGNRFFGCASK
jgi:hypothetical protein